MPNSMTLVWGPWVGTQLDATMFLETGVLDELWKISDEQCEDFSGFGDSAYTFHLKARAQERAAH